MLLPLGYFVWRYPLPGNVRPSDLGYLSRYGKPELWAYLGGVAALFCLYLLALQETRRISPRRALPVVFGWSAVHAALMGFMFPATAIDIFVYFAYARVFTVFGDNPMAVYAQTYYYDPVIGKLSGEWGYHPSAYGPIWHLISAPISWASGENIPRAVTGYKLLAIVCLLLGGWLIARALAASRPQDAATGALLYLWNPLVLWEVAGNGHNDAVMLVPLLLASVAWTRRRDVWVLPLIGIAALIKFVAAPLLPVAAVALWRRAGGWPARRRLAVRTGALGAVALVLGLFPFYDLNAIRTSIADTNSLFVVSPANAIAHLLENTYPGPEVKRWLKIIGWGILAAALVVASRSVWRRPDRLPRASFEVFFVFLMVVTTYFQGWYLVWPLALAALLPWGWPAWRMIGWCAGSMAVYAVWIWVRRYWVPDGTTLLYYGIPTISGLAALLTLAEIATYHARRVRAQRGHRENSPEPEAHANRLPQPGGG
jgi:hypothetical protein